MASLGQVLTSSIGKKVVMALTGILLILFLLEHVISNYMLLSSDGGLMYNYYAHFMAHNPAIRIAEVGLFALFLAHIIQGIMLVAKNKAARKQGYAVKAKNKKVTLASQIMGPLGMLILIFLVLHLANFFAKAKILEVGPDTIEWLNVSSLPDDLHKELRLDKEGFILDADGHKIRDLSSVVYKEFKIPAFSIFYIVMMIPLGIHLFHGFQSAFRTMGWAHPKYMPFIKKLGVAFSIIVPAAFAYIPLHIWLFK